MAKSEAKDCTRGQAYAVAGSLIALAAVIGAGLYIIGRSTPEPTAKPKSKPKTTSKKSAK